MRSNPTKINASPRVSKANKIAKQIPPRQTARTRPWFIADVLHLMAMATCIQTMHFPLKDRVICLLLGTGQCVESKHLFDIRLYRRNEATHFRHCRQRLHGNDAQQYESGMQLFDQNRIKIYFLNDASLSFKIHCVNFAQQNSRKWWIIFVHSLTT